MTTLIVDDRKKFSSPEIILSNILKELDFLQKVKKINKKIKFFQIQEKNGLQKE
jgi:hypothetical protein